MDIALNLNNGSDSLDVLKYAALYFDHITLDVIFAGNFDPIISPDVLKCATLLESERLLTANRFSISDHLNDLEAESLEILLAHGDRISGWDNSDYFNFLMEYTSNSAKMEELLTRAIVSTEAKDALTHIYGKSDTWTLARALFLYHGLLTQLLSHLYQGDSVLSNSEIISEIIGRETLKIDTNTKSLVALNIMDIVLPFFRGAEIEDILEIKYLARDELIQLKNYIESIQKELKSESISAVNPLKIQQAVEQKVVPAIKQFERKISNLKLKATSDFMKDMANPLTYSPLLTTVFTGISPIALLASSLGITLLKNFLNYKISENDVKNDPLYFTISLKRKLNPIY